MARRRERPSAGAARPGMDRTPDPETRRPSQTTRRPLRRIPALTGSKSGVAMQGKQALEDRASQRTSLALSAQPALDSPVARTIVEDGITCCGARRRNFLKGVGCPDRSGVDPSLTRRRPTSKDCLADFRHSSLTQAASCSDDRTQAATKATPNTPSVMPGKVTSSGTRLPSRCARIAAAASA